MRIVHLLNDVNFKGNGLGNVAIDLAIEQKLAGHESAIIALGGGYEPILEKFGVTHLKLPGMPTRLPWRVISNHWKFLSAFKPDIIHAHVRTGFIGAFPYSKARHVPLVAHLHNVHERESAIFRFADKVIAVSESVKESLSVAGFPEKKLEVVLNGPLRSPRLEDVNSPAVPLRHPAIVTVAGLNQRKGISELITAFGNVYERFPRAHLYIVGDGGGREEFVNQASQSVACANISFEGFKSDPRPYMRDADIFVLASRRESLGLVLLEARQCGCAIITTDVDGIPEAVNGGRAAILVPPQSPRRLSEAILRLLGDDDARMALSTAALEDLDKFTSRRMSENTIEIYEKLLTSRFS